MFCGLFWWFRKRFELWGSILLVRCIKILCLGDHDVAIKVDGHPLGVGPFVMEVGHPPKVSRLPQTVFVGKKLAFEGKFFLI